MAVKGRVPHNKTNAMLKSLEVNRETKKASEMAKKRKVKMHGSIGELMKDR
jgi:hypothetical protein